MSKLLAACFVLLVGSFAALAETAPSPAALKDLAPSGKLRAAINYGNGVLAQQGPDGAPRGVSADLAAELGKRLGVPVDYVPFHAAGKAFAALASGAVDVAFIAIEPARAAKVEFSAPYVTIEGTYMVHKDSPLGDVGDVDKPGIRIGVGLASVYDLYLTRTLKHAKLVHASVGGASAGIPVFLEQKLDAAAGVREPLDAYARTHPDMRVMPGAFEQIGQAVATVKGRSAGAAYVRAFVEELKANGFVAASLKRSGQTAPVAPLSAVPGVGTKDRAQEPGASYVVTYIEIAPSAREAADALFHKFRDTARKESGNTAFDIFRSTAQPRHFVLFETWHDARAQADHAAAEGTRQFRQQLAPMLIAPYDERLHTGFLLGPSNPYGKRAVYVITHVDFAGAKKDAGLAAVKRLSAGSVNDAGVLRYDVLEQVVKPNHLTLVEVWRDEKALEAHEQAEHTRRFRDELLPIGGSPFEEQLYRPLD